MNNFVILANLLTIVVIIIIITQLLIMSLEQFEKEILSLKDSALNHFGHSIALNDSVMKKNLINLSLDNCANIIGNLQCWFESNRHRFSQFRRTEFCKNLELAKKFRQNGNEQYRLNNFDKALEFYHKVSSFYDKLFNTFIF